MGRAPGDPRLPLRGGAATGLPPGAAAAAAASPRGEAPRPRSTPGLECFVSADWLTLNRRALGAVLQAARERSDLMPLLPPRRHPERVVLRHRPAQRPLAPRRTGTTAASSPSRAPLAPHPPPGLSRARTSTDCWPAAATSPASSTSRSTQKCWTRSTSGERRKSRARLEAAPAGGFSGRSSASLPSRSHGSRRRTNRRDPRMRGVQAAQLPEPRSPSGTIRTGSSSASTAAGAGKHTPHKETR